MRHQNLTFLRLICIESTTLYGNFEKVKLLLEITNHRFTAIGISETWLNETTLDLVEISGYNFISNHSINKSGG